MLNWWRKSCISKVTSVIPSGEAFGKWRGLNENVVGVGEIVWPLMVIIKNIQLDQDDNGKVIFLLTC